MLGVRKLHTTKFHASYSLQPHTLLATKTIFILLNISRKGISYQEWSETVFNHLQT